MTSLASNVRPEDILGFWFGTADAPTPMARWFEKDPDFDAEIRARFGDAVERAAAGELDAWARDPNEAPERALALVVLLDQFSRNLFRGTARSFAQDERALAISERMQASGADRKLAAMRRYVLLLPMMHSEELDVQRRGVAAFRGLLADATSAGEPESVLGALRAAVDFAERHEAIVARFGRFPHRNLIFGRTSRPEEIAFLLEPGSSF